MKHITASLPSHSPLSSKGKGKGKGVKNNSPYPYTQTPPTRHQVRAIAEMLVERFNRPDSFRYFCGVAWKLPRATIDRLAGEALEDGRTPFALFTCLVKQEIGR